MLLFVRDHVLFLVFLVLVSVAASAAVPLCNYRTPNSDIDDLGISFSYHYYNDPYGLSERDIDAGQLLLDYSRRHESPDFGFDVAVKNCPIFISHRCAGEHQALLLSRSALLRDSRSNGKERVYL